VIDNPNPTTIKLFLEKDMGYKYKMAKFNDETMEFPRDIPYQLTTLQINKLFENFDKR